MEEFSRADIESFILSFKSSDFTDHKVKDVRRLTDISQPAWLVTVWMSAPSLVEAGSTHRFPVQYVVTVGFSGRLIVSGEEEVL